MPKGDACMNFRDLSTVLNGVYFCGTFFLMHTLNERQIQENPWFTKEEPLQAGVIQFWSPRRVDFFLLVIKNKLF